jgi:hypothetical protein
MPNKPQDSPDSLLVAELAALKKVQDESAAMREALLGAKMDKSAGLLEHLLEQQADKAKEDAETRRFYVRYVFGPLLTALVGGVGYAGMTSGGTAEKVVTSTEDARHDLQKQIGALDRHLRANDVKYDDNLDYQLRRDVAVQETLEHVSKKLDAVSRRAAAIQEPEGMTRGRTAAAAIKTAEENNHAVDLSKLYVDETE